MKIPKNMKFEDIPDKVLFIYSMAMSGIPIGLKMYEEAIAEYPEYFPEQVKRREKWAKIPQSVHDEYHAESAKIREECYKDMPEHPGMYALLTMHGNLDAHDEWSSAYEKGRKKELAMLKPLHERLYKKYGIKFNGI